MTRLWVQHCSSNLWDPGFSASHAAHAIEHVACQRSLRARRRLERLQIRLRLLEAHQLTAGTTWHTAGMLWRLRPSYVDIELHTRTRQLAMELQEDGEAWTENGGLFIACNKERLAEYERLANTIQNYNCGARGGSTGSYSVCVVTQPDAGQSYEGGSFGADQAENEGRTLVVFKGTGPITLTKGPNNRQWGPSVLAPYAEVILEGTDNFADSASHPAGSGRGDQRKTSIGDHPLTNFLVAPDDRPHVLQVVHEVFVPLLVLVVCTQWMLVSEELQALFDVNRQMA